MSVFKLIKEYPNSPKIGYITVNPQGFHGVIHCSNHPEYWEEIIKYPIGTRVFNSATNCIYTKKEDGWYRPGEKTAYTDNNISKSKHISIISEEVVEKNYEILSFKGVLTGMIYHLTDNKLYKPHSGAGCSLKEALVSDSDLNIYSVKRLSDGEIFTIGDNIKHKNNVTYPVGIITCLHIVSSVIFVTINDRIKGFDTNISLVEQYKQQPLFTTEDDVDIYNLNRVWYLRQNNLIINEIYDVLATNKSKDTNHLYFSTKEAAEEYILMNKPCLSIKEITPIFGQMHLDNSITVLDRMTEKLKKLVKSKI